MYAYAFGMRITPVLENLYGVYVWVKADGKWFTNEENEVLHIPSKFGDLQRIAILAKTAAAYGEPDGRAKFIQGGREVTKSEKEDQMERLLDGKVPDPYDVGNMPGSV